MEKTDISAKEGTLRSLYEQYSSQIFGFCYRLLGNHEEAEDLTQEAFFRLYQNLDDSPRIDNPKAWIYTVTANMCRNQLKRKNREKISRHVNFEAKNSQTIEQEFLRKEEKEKLRRMIRELPERDQILLMLYQDNLSYAEIAQATGIKKSSIGKSLFLIINKLVRTIKKGERG